MNAVGVKDVSIKNNTGVTTDRRGYAVMPYANANQENRIAINSLTLSADTDIAASVENVVPPLGAVLRATFNAKTGMRALLSLIYRENPYHSERR